MQWWRDCGFDMKNNMEKRSLILIVTLGVSLLMVYLYGTFTLQETTNKAVQEVGRAYYSSRHDKFNPVSKTNIDEHWDDHEPETRRTINIGKVDIPDYLQTTNIPTTMISTRKFLADVAFTKNLTKTQGGPKPKLSGDLPILVRHLSYDTFNSTDNLPKSGTSSQSDIYPKPDNNLRSNSQPLTDNPPVKDTSIQPENTSFKPKDTHTGEDTREDTQVLLVTYLRSGSTLTADIIQQSSDVFYIYEPFHSFPQQLYYTDTQSCNISTGECGYPDSYFENPEVIKKVLYNMFTCQFQDLSKKMYRDLRFNAKRSPALRMLDDCSKSTALQTCVKQLEKLCRSKPVKLIKVIKVGMQIVQWLMKLLPNLNVIHLLRDPRGMLSSQMTGSFIHVNVSEAARVTCNRMSNDVYTSFDLSAEHSTRVKLILYETIAESPIEATRSLYNFVGLNLTRAINDYVLSITQSGKRHNGYYNVIRGDSVKTAYMWRAKLSWDKVRDIDQECSELYQHTGFKAFENELIFRDHRFHKSLEPHKMFQL